MRERMRSTGAAVLGFSLVWGVACGDTVSSGQGSAVTDGGGTTGTTGGAPTTSIVTGASNGNSNNSSSGSSTRGTGGSSTDGPVTSAAASTTGRAGAGPGGSDASAGAAGSGGADGDVDCTTDPCSDGEVCVPNGPGCTTTVGRCREANDAFCAGGAVCGCDGVVYDNRCEAYRAPATIASASECEQPAGTIACADRYCDADTESCQLVHESRCDGACLALCAGRHTVIYGVCVPALTDCEAAECDCPTCLTPAVSCTEGEDGITLVCSSGCVG